MKHDYKHDELEWLKYVEKVARTIKTPVAHFDTQIIPGTYSWKTVSTAHAAAKRIAKKNTGKQRLKK